MAYRIRYSGKNPGQKLLETGRRRRWLAAAGLLVLIWVISLTPGKEWLGHFLGAGERTLTEGATEAMAWSIAAGEGWYHGAVVFCNYLLVHGSP